MQFRCEYVGPLGEELGTTLRNIERLTKALEGAYRESRAAGELASGLSPRIAALETMMFMNGLLRLWIVHGSRSSIRRNARAAIKAHVRLRRAAHPRRGR